MTDTFKDLNGVLLQGHIKITDPESGKRNTLFLRKELKEKIIDSKRLDGELYANLDEIQRVMQERLSEFITQIVSDARSRAETWYGQKTKLIQQQVNNDKIDPNTLFDEDVPETSTKPSGLNKAQAAKEARNKLIAAMSDEQKNSSGEIVDSEEIQLPDGQVVKVNIRT